MTERSFLAELKRRNVFRVGLAYVVGAWLLLQLTEVLSELLSLPPEVGPAVVAIVVIGFPIVLFAAWAYELTPEGIKREKEVDRSRSITPQTGRKLNVVIIGLLLVAVGYFALDKFVFHQHEPPATENTATEAIDVTPSIAVLPLVDMSPGGDHEYFSDGLTEELLNILVKISELQVAGRTSSFAFKGQNQDLREIGRKLNVRHLLEGSVRKDEARNRVRITLQLIDADSGFHLWSETYDRDLDDIFAIQEEIAHQVASALRVTLLGEDEARLDQVASTNIDAYDLYLQGQDQLRQAGFMNLEQAENLFQQVLGIDPAYVPARLGLIKTWSQMAQTGALSSREAIDRGLPMLETILTTNPDNAAALAIMADYQDGQGAPGAADSYYRRSLEIEPRNALTLKGYGRFLYDSGDVERGVAMIDAAVGIEPYDIEVLWDACQTSAHLGLVEKGLTHCRRIQELAPQGPQGHYGEGLVHIYQGDMPNTLLNFRKAIERDPKDFEMLAAMAQFWIALGETRQGSIWLDRAEAIGAGQPVPTNARILLYEFNEQYDRAGDLVVQALARKMDNRHGTEYFFRRANAQHAMRTGRYEQGLAPYRELVPWIFGAQSEWPEDAIQWTDDLLFAAALLKKQDPLSETPATLVDYVERHAEDIHPRQGAGTRPYRMAAVHALRGDGPQALVYLDEYAKYQVMPYWRPSLIDNPVFHDLRDDPQFRDLVREAEAQAERQRIDALALLEVGE